MTGIKVQRSQSPVALRSVNGHSSNGFVLESPRELNALIFGPCTGLVSEHRFLSG